MHMTKPTRSGGPWSLHVSNREVTLPLELVITIEDAGHACALQKPEAFAAVIESASGCSRPVA